MRLDAGGWAGPTEYVPPDPEDIEVPPPPHADDGDGVL
jgi:hypothetical protein